MMKKIWILFFIFAAIALVIDQVDANGVPCEDVSLKYWYYGPFKTCFMDKLTEIDSQDVIISSGKDKVVGGMWFQDNKKITYLPIDIYKVLPNVQMIDAVWCSIKGISNKNFRNLHKLEGLFLAHNSITTIYSNTFEGLSSLKMLGLGENKIKHMNSEAFAGLNRLEQAWLQENECINIHFNEENINDVHSKVTLKCGFDEEDNPFPSSAIAVKSYLSFTVSCILTGMMAMA